MENNSIVLIQFAAEMVLRCFIAECEADFEQYPYSHVWMDEIPVTEEE